jgi:predicted nucleotidyltransferase
VSSAKRTERKSVRRHHGASEVKIFGSVASAVAGEELSELLATPVGVVAREVSKEAVSETAHADLVDV